MAMMFNRISGGGSGEYASILVTGLDSTDTITCTTPSGASKTGVWTQQLNEVPTYISGWLFSKLSEYGIYTFTSGGVSNTQDVDEADEYTLVWET